MGFSLPFVFEACSKRVGPKLFRCARMLNWATQKDWMAFIVKMEAFRSSTTLLNGATK